MDCRASIAIVWAAGAAFLGVLVPCAAAAQGSVAVVVIGTDDVASVREPVFGALRARNYTPVAPDTVDAAIAFTLSGEPITEANAPRLREAVGAAVLYLVQVRPAERRDVFFSVQVFDTAGTRSAFGRASGSGLAGAVVTEVLSLDANGPPPATAMAAPVGPPGGSPLAGADPNQPAPPVEAPVEVAEWVVPPGSTGVATREGIGPQAAPPPAAASADSSEGGALWGVGAVVAGVGSNGFNGSHSQMIFHLTAGNPLDSEGQGIGVGLFGATPSFDKEHYPGWFVGTAGFMVSGIVVGLGGGALIPSSGDAIGTFAWGMGGTLVLGESVGIALSFMNLIHSDPVAVDFMLGIGFGIGGPDP